MRGNKEVRVSYTAIHLLRYVRKVQSATTLLFITLYMGFLDVVSLLTKNKELTKLLLLVYSKTQRRY